MVAGRLNVSERGFGIDDQIEQFFVAFAQFRDRRGPSALTVGSDFRPFGKYETHQVQIVCADSNVQGRKSGVFLDCVYIHAAIQKDSKPRNVAPIGAINQAPDRWRKRGGHGIFTSCIPSEAIGLMPYGLCTKPPTK